MGVRSPGARKGIRTVDQSEFEKLKSDLLDSAKEVTPPQSYDGKAFQRSDGTIIGVRQSVEHGETLDVLKSSNETVLKNGYKVHKK